MPPSHSHSERENTDNSVLHFHSPSDAHTGTSSSDNTNTTALNATNAEQTTFYSSTNASNPPPLHSHTDISPEASPPPSITENDTPLHTVKDTHTNDTFLHTHTTAQSRSPTRVSHPSLSRFTPQTHLANTFYSTVSGVSSFAEDGESLPTSSLSLSSSPDPSPLGFSSSPLSFTDVLHSHTRTLAALPLHTETAEKDSSASANTAERNNTSLSNSKNSTSQQSQESTLNNTPQINSAQYDPNFSFSQQKRQTNNKLLGFTYSPSIASLTSSFS